MTTPAASTLVPHDDHSRPRSHGRGPDIGTPEYIAPELVIGEPADGRADQYALAAVVHEILTGGPPIKGSSPADTLTAQIHRAPPKLGEIRPELPASLCAAVLRGLTKQPTDRFDSCHEFAAFVLLHVPKEPIPPPRLACPLCDRMMTTPQTWAGRNGRCPGCRAVLHVADDMQSVVASGERLAPAQRR